MVKYMNGKDWRVWCDIASESLPWVNKVPNGISAYGRTLTRRSGVFYFEDSKGFQSGAFEDMKKLFIAMGSFTQLPEIKDL